MNISELARKLRVPTEELRAKLPELGFDIGQKAIKIPDRDAGRIQYAWREMKNRQYLQKKMEDQKARAERKAMVQEGTAETAELPATMTVREFAEIINMPIAKVMQELMRAGILASLNERIDFDTASIISEDLGILATLAEGGKKADEEGLVKLEEVMKEGDGVGLEYRAPVIVVMGHVDHGKTKLLDAIRRTNVIDTESGGITQHIGAYQVIHEPKDVKAEKRALTFIDTPGHEAFTVMRSRGAKVADIAILVVAADDGVQPQTREAIDIIKASHLPYIVAINKIDKEEANIEKIKSQLAELNLIPEEWGGKTIMIPISAKTEQNIEQLLDMILLVADLQKGHIMADPNRRAIGTIIESHVDGGEGPVATVLVQSGTLKVGDVLGVKGTQYGKVRAMRAWDGKDIKTAPPSTPVKIIGFKEAPSIGDIMEVPEDVKTLSKLKSQPSRKAGIEEITVSAKVQRSDDEDDGGKKPVFNLIIKADVLGSLEAILGMIEKIDNPYVKVKIVARGLGNITDTEILQAEATKAFVIAFNVKPVGTASALARDKKVQIGQYSVIYKLLEEVEDRVKLLVPAEQVYTELGSLKVLAIFQKTANGLIVGGQVTKGRIEKSSTARVMRDGQIIAEGTIDSLQCGKTDVRLAEQGEECGINFICKIKVEVGDVLEVYREEMVAR
ncbi:MAG: translation initiation factor IF-2 [Candidatus Uhrbacteria bacterium]|nr:translation initiation factor IF-2 [Candidatus Uhrbacteria bacterium]